MFHPFCRLSSATRRRALAGSGVLTLLAFVGMHVIHEPLENPVAPFGILSLQFAGDATGARAILESWDARLRLRAAFGLGFDYLFLMLYANLLALACVQAGYRERRGQVLHRASPDTDSPDLTPSAVGALGAWVAWMAGILDLFENALHLRFLTDETDTGAAVLAAQLAQTKWGLLAMSLGALSVAFLRGGLRR